MFCIKLSHRRSLFCFLPLSSFHPLQSCCPAFADRPNTGRHYTGASAMNPQRTQFHLVILLSGRLSIRSAWAVGRAQPPALRRATSRFRVPAALEAKGPVSWILKLYADPPEMAETLCGLRAPISHLVAATLGLNSITDWYVYSNSKLVLLTAFPRRNLEMSQGAPNGWFEVYRLRVPNIDLRWLRRKNASTSRLPVSVIFHPHISPKAVLFLCGAACRFRYVSPFFS